MTGGLVTVYLGCKMLQLPSDFWDQGSLGGRAIGLIAAAIVAAMVGLLFGYALATCIPVRSERAQHAWNVVWHYLACGVFVWPYLVSMALGKTLGAEHADAFIKQWGDVRYCLLLLAPAASLSLFTGLVLLLTRRLQPGSRPPLLSCWLIAAPAALAMAFLQFHWLRVSTKDWWMTGSLYAVIIVPLSAWFIHRAELKRRQLIAELS